MKLRRLNNTGLAHFAGWLDKTREGGKDPLPSHLLEHVEFSDELEWDVEIENRSFTSRYDLGEYLVEKLAACNQRAIQNDVGIWTWFALFWFDQLCPLGADGTRKPGRNDNYILGGRYRDFHRQAIRTSWIFTKEHGSVVQFIFSNPVSKRGELTEALSARPYFLSCKGIMDAANQLYSDPNRNTWKRGSADKKPGAVRRFAAVLKQFELTYDLFSMNGDEVLGILPAREFARFMPQPAATPSQP